MKNYFLIAITFCLMACPYKNIYITNNISISNGNVEISMKDFMWHSHKKIGYCSVEFRIKNTSSKDRFLYFTECGLMNVTKELKVDSVWSKGYFNPPQNEILIRAYDSAYIGLRFSDSLINFKDTLKFRLKINELVDTSYYYIKKY